MNTILTILIMCAIGYLAFIFFAETARLRLRPTSQRLRLRQSRGQWIGGLIALSSITAFFIDGSLVDKLKPALLVAAAASLVVAVIFNFTPSGIAEWFRNRKEKLMYGDLHNDRNTAGTTNAPAIAKAPNIDLTEPATDNIAAQQINVNNNDKLDQAEHPLADMDKPVMQHDVVIEAEHVLVDQANHDAIDPDIATVFPTPGFVSNDRPQAANSGSFESRVVADPDEIIVDDFFEKVDARETADTAFTTLPPEADEFEHPIELPDDTAQEFESVAEVDTLAEVDYVTETVAEDVIPESVLPTIETEKPDYLEEQVVESVDLDAIPEPGPDATEIDHLAFAMQSVNGDAIKLQQSVVQMNELHEREQYYRTQLHGARLAYEKAQEAQFEAQAHDMNSELERGVKKLQAERSNRVNLEHNLADKRRALMQAELRVSELEADRKARQQVFHDQMESLEKTKEMARNAAQLARRAAIMQQRARTTALKERAKRERLEVSAKKAVDIARNAISKLAEEERKNRSTHGFH